MYRLMLLCYTALAFCKTCRALLHQNKTARMIKKLKFFSAAFRTGYFKRHKNVVGLYADIDYFFDLYTVFFNPLVLHTMPLVMALTGNLYKQTAAWESESRLRNHHYCILTTMHTRFLYFDLMVLFFALARRGHIVYTISYDNFVRSMIERNIFIQQNKYFYVLSPLIKKRYGIPGSIKIALISEQQNNAVEDILAAAEEDKDVKKYIFVASDIAISAPKRKKNTFRFLNVDIAPKRGVSFFQRHFRCPVMYVQLKGSLRNRRIAEQIIFPYNSETAMLLPRLYALFEQKIQKYPLYWSNWTNFLTMQLESPSSSDTKKEKTVFRTQLISPSGIRHIAVTESGCILMRNTKPQ
ncbi:MAG: hypothetical protein P1P65_08895 [Treponema sp.]